MGCHEEMEATPAPRYYTIARWVFAAIVFPGFIAHVVLGRVDPQSYAIFGTTALGLLGDVWAAWVATAPPDQHYSRV